MWIGFKVLVILAYLCASYTGTEQCTSDPPKEKRLLWKKTWTTPSFYSTIVQVCDALYRSFRNYTCTETEILDGCHLYLINLEFCWKIFLTPVLLIRVKQKKKHKQSRNLKKLHILSSFLSPPSSPLAVSPDFLLPPLSSPTGAFWAQQFVSGGPDHLDQLPRRRAQGTLDAEEGVLGSGKHIGFPWRFWLFWREWDGLRFARLPPTDARC